MPEGHLIHAFADRIRGDLAGRKLRASSPQGRFHAAPVDGHRLLDVRAVGKHLLYDIENAPVLHVHLGMRGLFLRYPKPSLAPRPGTRMRLATTNVAWDLIAPSTCELLDAPAVARLLRSLGPDPLGPDDPDRAVTALRTFRGSVGAALVDQSVWAGVGNAWRAELLYLARLHPATPCADLTDAQVFDLWAQTSTLMAAGRDAGQVVSDPAAPSERWVYKREACRGCDAPVETAHIAGRLAHWCSAEQVPARTPVLEAPRPG